MYLNESLNEVLGKPGLGVLFRSEVLEYVCELLPEVECLLYSNISVPFSLSRPLLRRQLSALLSDGSLT